MSSRRRRIARVGSVGLGKARGFDQEPLGFYPTEARIGRILPRLELFPGGVWECACGDGALSRQLQAARLDVVSTDIVDRGFGLGGVDFLKTRKLLRPNIVTNPPFERWLEFARHALELGARKVALLGRVLQLEGWARAAFFERTGLARVWIVGRSKMRPPGTLDHGYGPMIAFAWYVWERDAAPGPIVRWARPA